MRNTDYRELINKTDMIFQREQLLVYFVNIEGIETAVLDVTSMKVLNAKHPLRVTDFY